MIPVKIRAVALTAHVFDKDAGITVMIDMDTMRRWKKTHDAWVSVQSEMVAAARSHEILEQPPEPPQPETQPDNGETITFDSRSYNGSGIPNGVPTAQPEIPHEPEQLSVPTTIGRPTTDVRQPAQKRKRGRPRQKAKSPTPEQTPDQAEVALT